MTSTPWDFSEARDDLARRFGISQQHVSRIRKGRGWAEDGSA